MYEYCPTVFRTLGPVGMGEVVDDIAEKLLPDVGERLADLIDELLLDDAMLLKDVTELLTDVVVLLTDAVEELPMCVEAELSTVALLKRTSEAMELDARAMYL